MTVGFVASLDAAHQFLGPRIEAYLSFCRGKAVAAMVAETEESLRAPARSFRRNFSRAELHVYNIRHIQHHAAQLIVRLRLDTTVDIPWISTGWRDPNPIELA